MSQRDVQAGLLAGPVEDSSGRRYRLRDLDPDRYEDLDVRLSGRFNKSIATLLVWASLPLGPLYGQLVVGNQNWRPGQVVELTLLDSIAREGVRIYQVHFDDEPIPFEILEPAIQGGPLRVRIRIPSKIRPGSHGVTVYFTDEAEEVEVPSAEVAVPSIVGLTIEEARASVRRNGLRIDSGDFRPSPSEFAVYRVGGQDPPPGQRVGRGNRVSVEISALSLVPEIVGLSLQEARTQLEERGLRIEAEGELPAETSAVSFVAISSQVPPPGTEVPVGGSIAASLGVRVPDLIGVGIEEVRNRLSERGLTLALAVQPAASGPFETALEQQPAAGLLVTPGTAIEVRMESRPQTSFLFWTVVLMVTVLAGAAWLGRAKRVRLVTRRRYQVRPYRELKQLRDGTSHPIWRDRELRLDIRLVPQSDPGKQSLRIDGHLVVEEH